MLHFLPPPFRHFNLLLCLLRNQTISDQAWRGVKTILSGAAAGAGWGAMAGTLGAGAGAAPGAVLGAGIGGAIGLIQAAIMLMNTGPRIRA